MSLFILFILFIIGTGFSISLNDLFVIVSVFAIVKFLRNRGIISRKITVIILGISVIWISEKYFSSFVNILFWGVMSFAFWKLRNITSDKILDIIAHIRDIFQNKDEVMLSKSITDTDSTLDLSAGVDFADPDLDELE